jgi:hypothetical protein
VLLSLMLLLLWGVVYRTVLLLFRYKNCSVSNAVSHTVVGRRKLMEVFVTLIVYTCVHKMNYWRNCLVNEAAMNSMENKSRFIVSDKEYGFEILLCEFLLNSLDKMQCVEHIRCARQYDIGSSKVCYLCGMSHPSSRPNLCMCTTRLSMSYKM